MLRTSIRKGGSQKWVKFADTQLANRCLGLGARVPAANYGGKPNAKEVVATGSNPTTLHRGSVTVHLLGTMHISNASATAAHRLIYDVHEAGGLSRIFLELDAERLETLRRGGDSAFDESLSSMLKSLLSTFLPGATEKSGSGELAGILRTALKAGYRAFQQVGFASGVEFIAAINAAEKLKVPVMTGDIEVSNTMSSLARAIQTDISPSKLIQLMMSRNPYGNGGNEVERAVTDAFILMASGDSEGAHVRLSHALNRESVRNIIKTMRDVAPNVTGAMLDDRDQYMAHGLFSLAKELERIPGQTSAVAIVGLAHVDGIEHHWQRLLERDDLKLQF